MAPAPARSKRRRKREGIVKTMFVGHLFGEAAGENRDDPEQPGSMPLGPKPSEPVQLTMFEL
jgi:hypothetical protein